MLYWANNRTLADGAIDAHIGKRARWDRDKGAGCARVSSVVIIARFTERTRLRAMSGAREWH